MFVADKSESMKNIKSEILYVLAKLQSCVEAMQDVVGETIPEDVLRKAAYENKFDLEKSLSAVLQGKIYFGSVY